MKYVLEVLFPYFLLLYVCDCITYVRARHVLLTSLFGKKFNLKKSGVRLAGLLPGSQAIMSHNLPIHCIRDGIYVGRDNYGSHTEIDKAEDFTFIKFQDLELIEADGKNIKFNKKHTIKAPSPASARFHAKFLNNIKKRNPAERQEKIKTFLSNSYDLDAIKKIDNSSVTLLTIIKIMSSCLFVLVFLFLPTALFSNLAKFINLNALLICTFSIYLLLLPVSSLALKKLYRSEKGFISYTLLSIIFAPVNAIHVLSYLTKDLFSRFNFLAIAAYFMPRDSFKELARKEMFLIDHFENEGGTQDWLKYWGLKREFLTGLLDRCEISIHEISTPPEKQDHAAHYYCPFCMTEYTEKRHACVDCEMALKAFDAERKGVSLKTSSAAKTLPN